MHLSLATHLCGGQVSAVKLSFSDEKATCGMCGIEKSTQSAANTISTENCCKDKMSFLAVDNNYNLSVLQTNKPVQQLLQVLYIPESIGFLFVPQFISHNTNVQPPGKSQPDAVKLSDICVFLI